MFCPNCGTQNAPGARFCSGCGTPLASAPQQPQQPQQQYRQPQQQYQQPRQTQYQPQYRQATGRAARKAAKRAAKKAGGGFLKKIVTAALVVSVGGVAVSVGSELLGGGGIVRSDSGDSVEALGVTLSIPHTVYEPGDTVTVTYDGVSEELAANGAWLGMAGHLNAPTEFLNQEFLYPGSGKLPMKAPQVPGTYQVRFFKGREASEDNLAASLEFAVVAEKKTEKSTYYVSQGFTYARKPSGLVRYGGYKAVLAQVDWGFQNKYFIITMPADDPEEGELKAPFVLQSDGSYAPLIPSYGYTWTLTPRDEDDLSVLFGPVDDESFDAETLHDHAYDGLYELEKRNGSWFIKATGDPIDIDEDAVELITSQETMRATDAGQDFMRRVAAYAAEKGYSMEEKQERESTPGNAEWTPPTLIIQGDNRPITNYP